jgi:isopentenyldiphosphate isomerase
MAENIDIYDANLGHKGVMERIKAHKEGEWHRTFHCWVVSTEEGGSLLFQQRSMKMKNFPGLLDVSAAGHIEAGEAIEEGVRELNEELGIEIDESKLIRLGERIEVADQANGQRNREYQSVYMYLTSQPISSYKPEEYEVTALVLLNIQDGFKLFRGEVEKVTMKGCSYEINENGIWEPFTLEATTKSFLPRIQQYYLTSLIMAERLLDGNTNLSIS